MMICRVVLLTTLLCSGLIIGRLLKQPSWRLSTSTADHGRIRDDDRLRAAASLLVEASGVGGRAGGGDLVLVTGFVYVTGESIRPFRCSTFFR